MFNKFILLYGLLGSSSVKFKFIFLKCEAFSLFKVYYKVKSFFNEKLLLNKLSI